MVGSGTVRTMPTAAKETSRPNILLIVTDQQHIDTISAGGCPHTQTPAMDRLARSGVTFRNSYSTNPVCSPARSSIFTGRMSTETGVYINGKRIRPDIPNIGQWLSGNTDYETFYAGKWHIPRTHPIQIEGFRVLTTGIGGHGILGDTSTSRACENYLRNRSGSRPFFMVAAFLQPHDICEWLRLNTFASGRIPYDHLKGALPELPDNFQYGSSEPGYLKRTRETRDPAVGKWDALQWRYYLWSYYRHVEMVDGEIGRILQALDDRGYGKNTLIVLTSDHGEGLARHQNVRKSLPYDEVARVPLIISWPDHTLQNKMDGSSLVSGVDIVPTVCDYAGVLPPKNMRGRSLRPLLEGKTVSPQPYVVSEMLGDRARMIRTERYKYVSYRDDPVDMLFDMLDDPGETKNIAGEPSHQAAVEKHRGMLIEWEKQLDVVPNLPGANAWWRKS